MFGPAEVGPLGQNQEGEGAAGQGSEPGQSAAGRGEPLGNHQQEAKRQHEQPGGQFIDVRGLYRLFGPFQPGLPRQPGLSLVPTDAQLQFTHYQQFQHREGALQPATGPRLAKFRSAH